MIFLELSALYIYKPELYLRLQFRLLNFVNLSCVNIIQAPGLGLTEFLWLIHHRSTGARAYVDTGLKIPFVHKIQVEPVRQRFNDSLKRFKMYKNLF